MNRFRQRYLLAVLLTATLLVVGTVGYLQFPGWTLSDAFYMAVITLTAVGYEEVRNLDTAGRLFTSALLAGGITTIGIWFALITATIVEMDLAHAFRKRRTMKTLEKMGDHVVVCGAGRMGRQVIKELLSAGRPYVVIERDPERAQDVRDLDPDAIVIEDDATRDETLVEARIGHARGLIAALSADTDNLFVCLSARDLQPGLTIVARAYDEDAMSKLRKAGADHVVSPNITGGIRMASVLLRPQVMSFLDVVTRGEELALLLEEVEVPEGSPLGGRTLAQSGIREKTGTVVLAIRHGTDRRDAFIYNPGPDERINPGDTLIVLGQGPQIDRLRSTLV